MPTAYYGADNPYACSAYDVLVQTALAVEIAGSYKASALGTGHVQGRRPGPGTKCYTYADCLKLIRAGKAIDYDGVTGPGTYTTAASTPSPRRTRGSARTESPSLPSSSTPRRAWTVLDQIKTVAKCTPENPPNKCT